MEIDPPAKKKCQRRIIRLRAPEKPETASGSAGEAAWKKEAPEKLIPLDEQRIVFCSFVLSDRGADSQNKKKPDAEGR